MARHTEHKRDRRRSKPDKGRAFLRFAIGILVLFILCATGYVLLMQGGGAKDVPAEVSPSPEAAVPSVAPPTAVPTPTPPAASTETPMEPAPTWAVADDLTGDPLGAGTPQYAERLPTNEDGGYWVPAPDGSVQCGMIAFAELSTDEESAITVRAWAYLTGADATESQPMLAIVAEDGVIHAVYRTQPTDDAAGMTFAPEDGTNLDRAGFSALIDVIDLDDGRYTLGVMIINGEDYGYAPLEPEYGFVMYMGDVSRSTGVE